VSFAISTPSKRYVLSYWEAILRKEVAYLGGGCGTIVILGIYERVSGHNVPLSVYSVCAAVAIIGAAVSYGLDQEKRLYPRIKIKNLTPRIWDIKRYGFTGVEFYVDVENLSEAESLEGCRVELISLDPDLIGFLPVPLHIKHDDYESREFSINPGAIRQIDILTGPVNHPQSQKEIIVPHTVNRERFPLPYGTYRLTIEANARNARKDVAVFQAWVSESGELKCISL
jgi:hypothetical protein